MKVEVPLKNYADSLVYMSICACVHTYIYVYICMHASSTMHAWCMHVYTCIYRRRFEVRYPQHSISEDPTCEFVAVHIHIHMHIYIHMYICIYVYMCIYINIYIHTYTYIFINTFTRMYMYTIFTHNTLCAHSSFTKLMKRLHPLWMDWFTMLQGSRLKCLNQHTSQLFPVALQYTATRCNTRKTVEISTWRHLQASSRLAPLHTHTRKHTHVDTDTGAYTYTLEVCTVKAVRFECTVNMYKYIFIYI